MKLRNSIAAVVLASSMLMSGCWGNSSGDLCDGYVSSGDECQDTN